MLQQHASKQRQLKQALHQRGWALAECINNGTRYPDSEVWVLESTWSPKGARATLDWNYRGDGPWRHYHLEVLETGRMIGLKRWDNELPDFVKSLDALRAAGPRC